MWSLLARRHDKAWQGSLHVCSRVAGTSVLEAEGRQFESPRGCVHMAPFLIRLRKC